MALFKVLALVLFFARIYSAQAETPRACTLEALAPLLTSWHQAQTIPEGSLSAERQAILEGYIVEHLREKLLLKKADHFRSCSFAQNCWIFEGQAGEKALEVTWVDDLAQPEVVATGQARVLRLPSHIQLTELQKQGPALLNQWTMGHSVHPYIRPPAQAGAPKAPVRLRPVQEQGIQAGLQAFKQGQKHFLYVSPTATGKTEVLLGILKGLLPSTPIGQFYLFTADQNLLVNQFKGALSELIAEKKVRAVTLYDLGRRPLDILLRKLQAHRADPSLPPLLVVTTIQGLRNAVAELEPTSDTLAAIQRRLNTVIFDESHHIGAPTYLDTINILLHDSPGKLLGTTATPVHPIEGIQTIFNHQGFWAYLDDPARPRAVKDGEETLYRTIQDVADQYQRAVEAGDLAPIENYYVIKPDALTGDSDESAFLLNGTNEYVLNPAHYGQLIETLAPLFARHQSGFVSVGSIAEAEALALALGQTLPNQTFVVLHSQMSPDARDLVVEQMRENKKHLFVITVRMLDEGVDFPSMNLYVDLNRTVGARQLLQRLGRVSRLSVGKEGVEVATLFDWLDGNQLAERLVLLDRVIGAYNSRAGSKGPTHRMPLALPALEPIAQPAQQMALNTLRRSVSLAMLQTNRSTIPLPAQLDTFVAINARLPRRTENPRLWSWIREFRHLDESQWPSLQPDTRAFIRDSLKAPAPATTLRPPTEARRSGRPPNARPISLSLLDKLQLYVLENGRLPHESELPGIDRLLQRILDLPTARWPELPSQVFELLLNRELGITAAESPVQRLNEYAARYFRLPEHVDDPGLRAWLDKAVRDGVILFRSLKESGLSPEAYLLLRKHQTDLAGKERHVLELNAHVSDHHALPQGDTLPKLQEQITHWLMKPDLDWPESLSPEARYLMSFEQTKLPISIEDIYNRYFGEPYERPERLAVQPLEDFVTQHQRLPDSQAVAERDLYRDWVEPYFARRPHIWPRELSPRLNALLRHEQPLFQQRELAFFIRDLESFVAEHGRLPKPVHDGHFKSMALAIALKDTPRIEWPGMSDELAAQIVALQKLPATSEEFIPQEGLADYQSLLARIPELNEYVAIHHDLPRSTTEVMVGLNRILRGPEHTWPAGLSEMTKTLLRGLNEKNIRQERWNALSPEAKAAARINKRVEESGLLPVRIESSLSDRLNSPGSWFELTLDEKQEDSDRTYLDNCRRQAEGLWLPGLSERAKQLIRDLNAAEDANMAATNRHYAIHTLAKQIAETRAWPNAQTWPDAPTWPQARNLLREIEQTRRGPEHTWPAGLTPELKEFIRERNNRDPEHIAARERKSVEELNEYVARTGELPHSTEGLAIVERVRAASQNKQWPANTSKQTQRLFLINETREEWIQMEREAEAAWRAGAEARWQKHLEERLPTE